MAATDHKAALEHFEEALVIHQALGAPYFTTSTEVALGAELMRSTRSPEREAGRSMLEVACAHAEARGYRYLVADAAARARLTVPGDNQWRSLRLVDARTLYRIRAGSSDAAGEGASSRGLYEQGPGGIEARGVLRVLGDRLRS